MTQTIVLIITILTSISCALIGNFLVLRKLAFMGDAISHAILPGIVVAFLMIGTLDSPLFFLLSVAAAVLMAMIIQFIVERSRISREAVIGIIFTALFSVGVILLVQFARNVHLDQDVIIYGHVEFSAWNKLILNGVDLGPRALWTMGLVFLVNLSAILLFWKELKITTFDQQLAQSLEISPKKIHYLIIILTSITIVAAFEAVGAILVVALLIVPPATAYIISGRLSVMIALSLIFAALAAILGYHLAFQVNGSIAGSVATMAGMLLLLTVLLKKFKTFLSHRNALKS